MVEFGADTQAFIVAVLGLFAFFLGVNTGAR